MGGSRRSDGRLQLPHHGPWWYLYSGGHWFIMPDRTLNMADIMGCFPCRELADGRCRFWFLNTWCVIKLAVSCVSVVTNATALPSKYLHFVGYGDKVLYYYAPLLIWHRLCLSHGPNKLLLPLSLAAMLWNLSYGHQTNVKRLFAYSSIADRP